MVWVDQSLSSFVLKLKKEGTAGMWFNVTM